MKSNTVKLFMLLSVILPQMSESIFSPCLVGIASYFNAPIASVEHVFTYYLFGYALGVLAWGTASDRFGPMRVYRYAILIYIAACVICMFAMNLPMLLFARVLQGFGGSACTIVVLMLARMLFDGVERLRMQANISMALSSGPAMGPLLGEFVLQYGLWQMIYVPFIIFATLLFAYAMNLQVPCERQDPSLEIIRERLADTRIWYYAIMIGMACGIGFSFFSEAPYLFMQGFGLSSRAFSYGFVGVGLSWFIGGKISHFLVARFHAYKVIWHGILTALLSAMAMTYLTMYYSDMPQAYLYAYMLSFTTMAANGLIIGNTLTLALAPYTRNIGTTVSVLAFLYYMFISVSVAGMAFAHDGSLSAMPSYWFKLLTLIGLIHVCLHAGPKVLFNKTLKPAIN